MTKTFVIDVTRTVTGRVQVEATTEADAIKKAKSHALKGAEQFTVRTVASWPLAEGATSEKVVGDYTIRRGWWYAVQCYGAHLGPRVLAVPVAAYPPEIDAATALAMLEPHLQSGERGGAATLVYGYSGTHVSLQTWGRVMPTEQEAHVGVRKFIESKTRFTRDQQRQEREIAREIEQEARRAHVVSTMFYLKDATLVRIPGGLWVSIDDAEAADDDITIVAVKSDIDMLLAKNLIKVTERYPGTDSPIRVRLTSEGMTLAVATIHADAAAKSLPQDWPRA